MASTSQTNQPGSVPGSVIEQPRSRPSVTHYVLLGLTLLLALGLRVWALDSIPPGVNWDQAVNVTDALNILAGQRDVFFEGNTGREGLYFYAMAPVIAALGTGIIQIRLVSVAFGMAIVLGSYLLGRQLFGERVALLATALAAVSFWGISLSRMGFRAVSLPAVLAFALWLLWRGIRRGGLWHFPAGGALLGLVLYTYTSGRWIVPGILGLMILALLLVPSARLDRQRRIGGIIAVTVATLIVCAPLISYFVQHPEIYNYRSSRVTVVSPIGGSEDPGETWLDTAGRTLGVFVIRGDPWDANNLPGRPVFDPVLGAFFLLGLPLLLRKERRLEGLFTLAWVGVVIGPLSLTQDTPHSLRMAGMMPAVYFIPAVGLIAAGDWLARRASATRALALPAMAAVVAVSGVWATRDYFVVLPSRIDSYLSTQADVRQAVEVVKGLEQQPNAPSRVFLSSGVYYGDPQPYVALAGRDDRVQGFNAHLGLVFPQPDQGRVAYVLNTSQVETWQWLERFLPAAAITDRRAAPDGREAVRAYVLDSASFQPHPDRELRAQFGDAVELLGYDFPRKLEPGSHYTLVLYWRIKEYRWYGWRWAATIVDSKDQTIAHTTFTDSLPVNSWRVGEVVASWMDLPVPEGTPPGVYNVRLEMNDSGRFNAVRVYDGAGKDVGTVLRTAPARVAAPAAAPAIPLSAQPVSFGGKLELTGEQVTSATVRPGDQLDIKLAWRSVQTVNSDYHYFVHLVGPDGKLRAQKDGQPQDGALPTSLWSPGEVVQDTVSLQVPPDMPAGTAKLVVGLYELPSGARLAASRGSENLGDSADIALISVAR